uniref:Probable pectate lyase F n=1 Tax=Ditylenchus dipsaci TaxID=166011 RepID=A0A915D9J3_9BILA
MHSLPLLTIIALVAFNYVDCQSFAAFPTASNCETIPSTNALGDGGQNEKQKAVIEVEDGGSVANVVFGPNAADGIHCKGSCTLTNVWWTNVGEDAATFRGGANTKVVVDGGGAKSASDKTFQHNGGGSVTIKNFQCIDCGKVYRACGNCETPYKRTVTLSNVKVTNLGSTFVGINANYGDTATISKLIMVGSKKPVCETFQGTTDNNKEPPKDKVPNPKNCLNKPSDVTYQ